MYMTKIYSVVSVAVLYYFYHYFIYIGQPRHKLIYILLDGLRSDFFVGLSPESLPGFHKLIANGSQARYMTPVYPSVAYPEWTTLVTGLWPESHGIVGNYFYDSREKDAFMWKDSESVAKRKWWKSEPIWVTATKADLATGVLFWGQCDIEYDLIRPSYCEPNDQNTRKKSFHAKVQLAMVMIELGFDFVQIYEDQLVEQEQIYGPGSNATMEAVRDIDGTILYMLDFLEQKGLADQVNIIVVGGHGMASTDPEEINKVDLNDYLDEEKVENVAGFGAFVNIKVKEDNVEEVIESLTEMTGVSVYRHDEIPDEFHLKNSEYVYDVILEASNDTYIVPSDSSVQILSQGDYSRPSLGTDGYDPNKTYAMRAAFLAYGPDFRNGFCVPPIQSVDVYSLLTHLLQIEPLPNNGTFENINNVLKEFDSSDGSYDTKEQEKTYYEFYSYQKVYERKETVFITSESFSVSKPTITTDTSSKEPIEDLDKNITSFEEGVADNIANVSDIINETISENPDTINETVADNPDIINETIDDISDTISEKTDNILDIINETISENPDTINETVADNPDIINETTADNSDTISETIDNILDIINETIANDNSDTIDKTTINSFETTTKTTTTVSETTEETMTLPTNYAPHVDSGNVSENDQDDSSSVSLKTPLLISQTALLILVVYI